ncbi:MAG: cation-translocating P-type ATPase [Candidatus Daviesbacteria bacterium]|nr:cation-translocating P-type ATPase [Candidatus Daviesbacteria bacterium]
MSEKFIGLTEAEAAKKLEIEGFNSLPQDKKKGFFSILISTLKEPMFILLIISVALYFFLGDFKEALALSGSICIIVAISFYQNQKTEKALAALKELSEPMAKVIREGIIKTIPAREIVPEDILVLSEGERIPADAAILDANNLTVDESILTGESLAVSKTVWNSITPIRRPGGPNLPFLYSGTLITTGHCYAKVIFTGPKSEIGKIGKALSQIKRTKSHLQEETNKFIYKLALLGGILCLVVVIIYGVIRNNWMEGFLAGITLSLSILPEEFVVIMTVFLALGAWRISKKGVLTKDIPAIETLGATTVLCVDKTGTVTFNKMSVAELFHQENTSEQELLEYAVSASRKNTFDPVEIAILEKAKNQDIKIIENKELIKEYTFSKEIMAITNVWQLEGSKNYIFSAKGAPETIIKLCKLSKTDERKFIFQVSEMASTGLKVLAVAKAEGTSLPKTQNEINYKFLGLIGLVDPVRPTVPAAIQVCHKAGIKVIMVTGDYPETAKFVAHKIGLENIQDVVTGQEVSKMSDTELQKVVATSCIFARIIPEEKLRIVNALKANGEIVAMTGDGINDAPALAASHIGIALGQRSTDVAKESASLVLLNGDFSSLVEAISLGRRIYTNIKRAVMYTLAIHVPIAGIALIPPLFHLPLILFPLHIVFLELFIDPSSAIAFETTEADKDTMLKHPRRLNLPFLDNKTLYYSIIQGGIILSICLGVIFFTRYLGFTDSATRTITFVCLILSNIGAMFANINGPKNILHSFISATKSIKLITLGTITLLLATILIPGLRNLFLFSELNTNGILIAIISSLISITLIEIFELIMKTRIKKDDIY